MPCPIPCFSDRSAVARSLVVFPALLAFGACAPEVAEEELDETTSSIINGRVSGPADDAVVRVFQDAGDGSWFNCTGTLLAANLVLTARHCVEAPPPPPPPNPNPDPAPADAPPVEPAPPAPAPDPNAPINGCFDLGPNAPASAFRIAVGSQNDDAGFNRIAALVVKVFTPANPSICSNDVALLQLDRKIPNARTKRIRTTPVKKGERNLVTIGFGKYSSADDAIPATRRKRSGLEVLAAGPATATFFRSVDQRRYTYAVAANDLATGESSCNGDSGGPLFDRSGAIVGVSSRGVPLPSRCIDAPALYAGVAAHLPLIREAAAAVGLKL